MRRFYPISSRVHREDHINNRPRFPVPNEESLSYRVTQTTGHKLQELVLGQVIGPSKPWPIDVDLGLLVVGLVVAGSHPGKRINLSLTITSGVPWTKKG